MIKKRRIMHMVNALVSGMVGAGVVSALNESVRRAMPGSAPRMEILGMRAAKAGFEAAHAEVPPRRDLIWMTFAGEVVSNSAYYSMVSFARPENALAAGAALGLAAGIGAVVLPGPLGLGDEPSSRTPQTKAMTVAWYLAGGVAAGLAWRALGRPKQDAF
jgi:hypothetical protein